jgi:hypothetical protein
MKRSSSNPVKTLGGIDSYSTSEDQFAAEHYIHYNSSAIKQFAADATFTKHAPLKSLLSC